jgi:hypothetical protein
MTTLREAARQALERLMLHHRTWDARDDLNAITALRAALAQEDETQKMLRTLGFDHQCPESIGVTLRRWKDGYAAALAQQEQPKPTRAQQMREAGYTRRPTLREMAQEEQEPVAWIHRKHYLLGHAENMPPADKALAQGWEPLYTHPPRHEWRGLTMQEINALPEVGGRMWNMGSAVSVLRAIRAVEAALKEKNND